jgi:hypothetical protein
MEYGVKSFDYDAEKLSADEKLVLEHLAKAGDAVNDIWKKQVDPKTGEQKKIF